MLTTTPYRHYYRLCPCCGGQVTVANPSSALKYANTPCRRCVVAKRVKPGSWEQIRRDYVSPKPVLKPIPIPTSPIGKVLTRYPDGMTAEQYSAHCQAAIDRVNAYLLTRKWGHFQI
jgi:hypothetical protein